MAANLCLLSALRALPSAVVFAVSSAAGVVLAAVTGVVVWRERLSRPAVGGVALAAVAVVVFVRPERALIGSAWGAQDDDDE